MEKLSNIHPGEILLEEFLKPLNISAYRLSKDLGIPETRTSEIIKGNRSITADTAIRLSYILVILQNSGLDFRMTLILKREKKSKDREFKHIKRLKENAAW